MAEDVVDSVIDVEAADVPETRFAEVDGPDLVRREYSDRRRTNEDAVAVVVEVGAVAHEVHAELLGVTADEKVLPIQIGDGDLLIAEFHCVEAGVGVFLEPVEDGQVVLVAIGRVVAEDARAEVGVVEDEAAKIAVEWLRTDADGDEVVVRRKVAKLPFVEELLH